MPAVRLARSLIVSRSALTGRTSKIFSDDFHRGPGWSIQPNRAPRSAVSPFTDEGSPSIVQWIGFDHLARDTGRPRFGTLRFGRIIVPDVATGADGSTAA